MEKVKEPLKAVVLQKFRVRIRHSPLPKKLKDLVVEAAHEDEAWKVFVKLLADKLASSDSEEEKRMLALVSSLAETAHRSIQKVG